MRCYKVLSQRKLKELEPDKIIPLQKEFDITDWRKPFVANGLQFV